MLGSFEDFRQIIRKAFRYTKPGGWMESQEIMPTPYCDDGTLSADCPVVYWAKMVDDAAMQGGRPLRIANKLKRWYIEAGFEDVHEQIFRLPINPWPKDPHYKDIGRMSELNLLDGVQAFSLAHLHRVFGWTRDEIEVYLINVRKAISDRSVHAYYKVYVFCGPSVPSHALSQGLETVAQTDMGIQVHGVGPQTRARHIPTHTIKHQLAPFESRSAPVQTDLASFESCPSPSTTATRMTVTAHITDEHVMLHTQ